MKLRFSIIVLVIFNSLVVLGRTNTSITSNSAATFPQIDALDKIVFDMSSAVMNGNSIDIPVYILSNDVVNAIDFALKFNESNLIFDSIISYKPYLVALANFNSSDRFLRFTSNSISQPIQIAQPLFAIRFHFNNSGICKELNETDFNSITVYLNGDPCSYSITTPPPFKVPDADFTNNRACLGNTVFFNDVSQLINDNITSWKWNFGNGNTSILQNPTVIYGSLTSFTVSLIVATNAGCADTVKKVLNVTPTPVVSFSSFSDCMTGNVNFTDHSTVSAGSLTAWQWAFGDSFVGTQQHPLHNYFLGGTYTASLTVISDSGCTATASNNVTVNNLSAIFDEKNGCVGETLVFNDVSTSTPSTGPITNWTWYFGDGMTSSSQNTSYVYNNSGTYVVSLKVTNSNCLDSVAKTILVQDEPIVDFVVDKITGCSPLSVKFTDSSITSYGTNYFWNFGDGDTISATDSTIHTYINYGTYTVKHVVTTSAGCVDSTEKISLITVNGAPVNFSPSSSKVKSNNAIVSFTNLSTGYSHWLWSFGDSTYSTLKSPEYTFKDTGVYNVCLFAADNNDCSYTYCDTITVLPPNVIAIADAFTPNGDNVNDSLLVRGGPMKEIELSVYNEWGNRLFFSNEQQIGWDGTFKGIAQPEGTYQYIVSGKTVDDEPINLHGVVTLIR